MAKRKSRADASESRVHHLRPLPAEGWDPLYGPGEPPREQRYMRKIKPRSPGQAALLDAIAAHQMVLALGPAGTGKTYIAVSQAVAALERGEVERILLSRPAIEAGETLGFLPGDLEEKMSPYLRPLYDALLDRLGAKRLKAALADGTVEIAPIAYMRGRTLNNSFVVLDEAQNCTYAQLKMLLTRLGWHATMVLTGDPQQTDLLDGMSGLAQIARRLATLEGVSVIHLDETDIVRHPLVAAMIPVL